MHRLALCLLTLVLADAALTCSMAGVASAEWSWCLLALGIVSLLYFAFPRRDPAPPFDRPAAFAAGLVLFFVSLQLAPLPVALVRWLSPQRVELHRAVAPVTNVPADLLTLTAMPRETVSFLLAIAGYLLVVLLVRDITLRFDSNPWIAVWPVLAIAGLEAVLGLFQAAAGASGDIATGTFPNRDHYAGLLEMALPFAVLYPLAILKRDLRRHESPARPAVKACVALAGAAVILIAVIFSLSRMAFLASLASLFLAGSLALSVRGAGSAAEIRLRRRWLPSIVVAAIVILAFVFLPTDPLIQRFSELARTDEISADTRAQLWRDTASLVKDYPLFGCGMGAYESCFLRYKTVAPMNTANYAHNDYLQVLAELGVFGFAAGLFFLVRVLHRTARAVFRSAAADERYLAIACLAAMTAMLLHSLVDFNMYVPANAMTFAWIVGIAGIYLFRRRRARKQQPARQAAAPSPAPAPSPSIATRLLLPAPSSHLTSPSR